MKENKFRFLKGGAVATLVALTAISPAFADETSTQDAAVTYSGVSTYTLTIPKEITIDSSTKEGSYTVSVSGDLANGDTVTITPASSFTMSDANGKANVTANVSQLKTSWNSTEAAAGNVVETGKITAPNLSAGEWSGTLTFTITHTASSTGGWVDPCAYADVSCPPD